uniref:Reverse transcriptase Ty1/copia-type domain-containing protein n=1 Tax=Strigamia maritima TaxID=126957 RepID=T1ILT9_STRMM
MEEFEGKTKMKREVKLYTDSMNSIQLLRDGEQRSRTKYLNRKVHFIKDHIKGKAIILEHVPGEEQLADFLTKPLAKPSLPHQPSLKYNAILIIIKRSLEKASLIQGSSRHRDFEPTRKYYDHIWHSNIPIIRCPGTPFPEDVVIGTDLLKINVVNRPENSD